ncbi:MAG TPA: ATP/GTP-binding protein [Anaerolineae bacterium]|nr:ATP/GTP-binding protein [Anaerolineae bacterium]
MNKSESVNGLLKQLKQGKFRSRAAFAAALGNSGNVQFIPLLENMLQAPDTSVYVAAFVATAQLAPDREWWTKLLTRLENSDTEWWVELFGNMTAAERKWCENQLFDGLQNKDPRVRVIAARQLSVLIKRRKAVVHTTPVDPKTAKEEAKREAAVAAAADAATSAAEEALTPPPEAAPIDETQQGTQIIKIVITGPFASGKTTFISSLSEVGVMTTEKKISTAAERIKDTTTVAMDYGRIAVDDSLVVHLFCTPGQKRFDFMWDVIARGMQGLVLVVDSTRSETFREAKRMLEAILRSAPNTAVVIAANKQDHEDAWTSEDMRLLLRLDESIKVVPCVALDKDSVKNVLIELIFSIFGAVLDDVGDEADFLSS